MRSWSIPTGTKRQVSENSKKQSSYFKRDCIYIWFQFRAIANVSIFGCISSLTYSLLGKVKYRYLASNFSGITQYFISLLVMQRVCTCRYFLPIGKGEGRQLFQIFAWYRRSVQDPLAQSIKDRSNLFYQFLPVLINSPSIRRPFEGLLLIIEDLEKDF